MHYSGIIVILSFLTKSAKSNSTFLAATAVNGSENIYLLVLLDLSIVLTIVHILLLIWLMLFL